MNSRVKIVIPVYRSQLTDTESISVSRCLQVLANYPICFAAPQGIDAIQGFENIPIEYFDPSYFHSLNAYNRLMLNETFYERFEQYQYILIYQTDAFVFRDELDSWCLRGYTYAGAPWLLKRKYRTIAGKLLLRLRSLPYHIKGRPFRPLMLGDKSGNGGLSLRKVSAFLTICRTQHALIESWIERSQQYSEYNEDAFWATRPDWKYPTIEEGLAFSFDTHPAESLKQSNRRLPFGCHGWSKAENKEFWEPIISRVTGHKPITVYYDYQAFTHQKFGGVSRYFAEIISRIRQYNIDPQLGLYYSDNTHLKEKGIVTQAEPNIDKAFMPAWSNNHAKTKLYKVLAHLFPSAYPYPKYTNRRYCAQETENGKFDIIHATYFDNYILSSNKQNKPLVITIHDMIDEVTGKGHAMPKRKARLAKEATHIIAVSEHTKQDIMRILHIPSEKISVVYHGCSISTQVPKHIPTLPEKYILYVGGRGRDYKNFPLFIEAMQAATQQEDLELVCVGSPFTAKEQAMIQSAGLKDKIRAIFADDDQLYYIYNHATCFIFPSCYEGFGLPILESWAANCPLILSRSSCFPEIAGDAALYFTEGSATDLAHITCELIHNDTLRSNIVRKGKERLKLYSWDKAAEQLANIYKDIYSRYI